MPVTMHVWPTEESHVRHAGRCAQNWEHAYIEFLEAVGFSSGTATPCVFHNRERDIYVVVRGDDFIVLASENQLDWFRREIANDSK